MCIKLHAYAGAYLWEGSRGANELTHFSRRSALISVYCTTNLHAIVAPNVEAVSTSEVQTWL